MDEPKNSNNFELVDKGVERHAHAANGEVKDSGETQNEWLDLPEDVKVGFTQSDRRDMQRMGKQQEFRRNFRIISTIGFTTCVMGTWEIVLTANTQGLIAGGKAGLFWSLTWAYVGQLFVVLSLAEMASMAPTAGGQYHWVSEFAPRSLQKSLSYFSGWLSAICWQSFVAIDAYLIGSIIQSLITMNDSSYEAQRWQSTLIIFASVISVAVFNIFCSKRLPLAEGIFVSCHFLLFFPLIVVLLVLAPKSSASEVFTGFTDNGAGWPNVSLTVMVGQVSAIFAVLGSDSVAHMSEEIEEAGTIVPKAMVWSFLLNIPFSFGILLTYLFCMPSVTDAVSSATGFPFIYVFQSATNSAVGATIMVVVILILIVMITISTMASTSRQTFAFARDNGLPFSRWLGTVHPRFLIPVNSIIFTCIFTMGMSLINIGSTVAFNALLSLSSVALMTTYVISIGCVTWKRVKHPETLPNARWSLGRYGIWINILGLIYAVWAFFWSFWPNSHDVTAQNFNWACVLFVGFMMLAGVLYATHARNVYDGPVAKVEGRKFN